MNLKKLINVNHELKILSFNSMQDILHMHTLVIIKCAELKLNTKKQQK